MKVKDVLKPYVSRTHAGGCNVVPVSDAELTVGLSAVSRANHMYFQFCFAALLLLFSASCILVGTFLNDPGRLGALFTITGMSMVALIAQMLSLRKQKVTADVIAVLAGDLQPHEVPGVIKVLLARL